MFIVYGLKRFFRNLLSSSLLTLLLTSISILLCLSVSLTYAADTICQNLDDFYTTLAVLRPSPNIGDYPNSTQGNADYRADSQAYRSLMQDLMTDETVAFEHIEQIDRRLTVFGTGEGISPVTVGMTGEYQLNGDTDFPNNVAVVVVEMFSAPYDAPPPLSGKMAGSYAITEVVTAYGAYDMLGKVSAMPAFSSKMPDGFDCNEWKLGERYLVLCTFNERSLSEEGETLGNTITLYPNSFYSPDRVKIEEETVWNATKVTLQSSEDGGLTNNADHWIPVMSRFEGDVESFLASERGRAWRELTIPWVERQISSVLVTGTENVGSLQYFNTGKARLVEGRFITEEEYKTGAPVCLVSAALAQANQWVPGDTVELDLYPANMQIKTLNDTVWTRYNWVHHEMRYYDESSGHRRYTIVGLYQTKNLTLGDEYYISPNTVFVPQGTLSDQYVFHEEYGYTGAMHANMISLVIPNDEIEAFRAEAEALGYGNAFLYNDQGYSAIANMLMAIEDASASVLYMCLGLWTLAAALAIFLFFHAQRRYAATMYGLGCRERQIYAYLVPQFLCLIVATGILGCWGSVRLYDRVVFWMLQGNIRPFDDAFSALSTAGGSVDEVMQYLSLPTDAFVGVMMLQCVILLAIFALAALIFVLRRYDRR